MSALYPLRFTPIFRRYLWGGRRLATVLGKPIGRGDDYAESWEIVDHGADQSVVADGPLAGTTLADLVAARGAELLGRHHPQSRFPLLWKFLDAQKTLSVQVHPNDAQAARLDPPDLGKTEAWVILDVEPESLIYAGLKRGVGRREVERQLAAGKLEECLHRFTPRVGDCIFIPAGTVHAIGAGLMVAEIQQASDATFRLYDWNRLDAEGRPRQLHIAAALDCVDFRHGPVQPVAPQATERRFVNRLVHCDKFVLDRWTFDSPQTAGGDDRCHVIGVLAGEVRVPGDERAAPLLPGETMLLPAACGAVELTPRGVTTLLDAYLP